MKSEYPLLNREEQFFKSQLQHNELRITNHESIDKI